MCRVICGASSPPDARHADADPRRHRSWRRLGRLRRRQLPVGQAGTSGALHLAGPVPHNLRAPAMIVAMQNLGSQRDRAVWREL
jgi:hypothetical protein